MFQSIWNSWLSFGTRKAAARPRKASYRLSVDALENRVVPCGSGASQAFFWGGPVVNQFSGQSNFHGCNGGGNAPGTIAGVVYLDASKTGVYAKTDAGLSAVTVTLTGTNYLGKSVSVTETSGANGAYSFTGMLPGTYALTYGAPAGDVPEAPAASQLPTGATATAGKISNIVLTGGKADTINLPDIVTPPTPVTISGVVYLDTAKTGVYAQTDVGQSGVSVTLTGTNYLGQAVSVTIKSGANGAYSFTGVLPGTYAITYGAPTGDSPEAPASSQLPSGATAIAGKISSIVVTSGNSRTINLPDIAPSGGGNPV